MRLLSLILLLLLILVLLLAARIRPPPTQIRPPPTRVKRLMSAAAAAGRCPGGCGSSVPAVPGAGRHGQRTAPPLHSGLSPGQRVLCPAAIFTCQWSIVNCDCWGLWQLACNQLPTQVASHLHSPEAAWCVRAWGTLAHEVPPSNAEHCLARLCSRRHRSPWVVLPMAAARGRRGAPGGGGQRDA